MEPILGLEVVGRSYGQTVGRETRRRLYRGLGAWQDDRQLGGRLGGSVDPRLGVQGAESWCRMVLCLGREFGELERSLDVDLGERLDQPMGGGQPPELESVVSGEKEEELVGVESLEGELGLMGLAAPVLLGWEGFDLDNLFMVGLVLQSDLGWSESTLGLSGLVQLLLWKAAVFLVVNILAALGLGSVGLMPSLMFLVHFLNKDHQGRKEHWPHIFSLN